MTLMLRHCNILFIMAGLKKTVCQRYTFLVLCQKQVSRAWTSNYTPQYLCDVITCPCPRDLFWHNTPDMCSSNTTLTLQWHHNERDCVSNHRHPNRLLNRFSCADQGKHQSSASLAFERGIHRWPVKSPHKEPATRKMFPFDDVIIRTEHKELFKTFWLTLFHSLAHLNTLNVRSWTLFNAVEMIKFVSNALKMWSFDLISEWMGTTHNVISASLC